MPYFKIDKAQILVLLNESMTEIFRSFTNEAFGDHAQNRILATLGAEVSNAESAEGVKAVLKLFHASVKENPPQVSEFVQRRLEDLLKSFYKTLCAKWGVKDSIEFSPVVTGPEHS